MVGAAVVAAALLALFTTSSPPPLGRGSPAPGFELPRLSTSDSLALA